LPDTATWVRRYCFGRRKLVQASKTRPSRAKQELPHISAVAADDAHYPVHLSLAKAELKIRSRGKASENLPMAMEVVRNDSATME
jgi:hypothetical protein